MPASDLHQLLSRALTDFGQGLVCAYLYGSRARGDARPDSDVDVAVLFDHPQPASLAGLRFDLAATLESAVRMPVDLVVLNAAPVDLVHRVLRDGILLHEGDRAARIRFEVRARNEYFDLLPILKQYRGHTRGQLA